ncbi:MAG: hypothetical protein Q9170_006688 [Blastenia crenularia]
MKPHVCVIGAGVSGLRCATVLLQNAYDVTIIEARDRIGGSTGCNPIIDIARETGTPLHRWKDNILLYDGDGNLLNSSEARQALNQVWEILEAALEHSKQRSNNISHEASLNGFFESWCEWASQHAELTKREAELVLEDCFIPTNYESILARIAAAPLAQARVQFNTVMTRIEASKDQQDPVCVSTSDGKEQHFDDVVVTTPLGWLKQHRESIRPLDPRIESAIESMSFGRLEKVLIEFPTAFWESATTDTRSDNEDFISFVHWLAPSYAAQSNPHQWRLECVSFHAFPEPYQRNILLFYTFGDCSTHVTSSIKGLQGEARDQWLRTFFEPYYSRLPGYTETCMPLRFLATEWCNDEFAGNGSYSNFQVGMTDAAKDVEAIRHGMPEQHIYFAGEHTAPFDGLGTVAGAYTSGEMIAKRIIEGTKLANTVMDVSAMEERPIKH